MIIAGAGGHAKEILTELQWLDYEKPICFFDNTTGAKDTLFDWPVLHNEQSVQKEMTRDKNFIIGVGTPATRESLYWQLVALGAVPYSLLSRYAYIGHSEIVLGDGLNVMAGVIITASITIGKGTLVHAHCSIHHDSLIGEFCELSPGCRILGRVNIGNSTSIGTNAVLLPGISIGNYVKIGAGAIVTKNVPDGVTVKGVPGRW